MEALCGFSFMVTRAQVPCGLAAEAWGFHSDDPGWACSVDHLEGKAEGTLLSGASSLPKATYTDVGCYPVGSLLTTSFTGELQNEPVTWMILAKNNVKAVFKRVRWVLLVQIVKRTEENFRKSPEELSLLFCCSGQLHPRVIRSNKNKVRERLLGRCKEYTNYRKGTIAIDWMGIGSYSRGLSIKEGEELLHFMSLLT